MQGKQGKDAVPAGGAQVVLLGQSGNRPRSVRDSRRWCEKAKGIWSAPDVFFSTPYKPAVRLCVLGGAVCAHSLTSADIAAARQNTAPLTSPARYDGAGLCLSCEGASHGRSSHQGTSRCQRLHGIELSGFFVLSFSRACINLNAIVGDEMASWSTGSIRRDWLPASSFRAALDLIADRYPQSSRSWSASGMEMMRLWYEFGPGRSVVKEDHRFSALPDRLWGYASGRAARLKELVSSLREHIDPSRERRLCTAPPLSAPCGARSPRRTRLAGMRHVDK